MRWSPNWTVVGGTNDDFDEAPVLTAGPDVRFELDGIAPATARTLRSWSNGETIDPTDDETRELRDLLVGLGAVLPEFPPTPNVAVVGKSPDGFLTTLTELGLILDESSADLTLVVRSEQSWPEAPDHPHLGVDLVHHHTLVLGPLVIPGATSCLSCLARQTERSWGQDHVAAEPAIRRWIPAIASLVAIQVERAIAGDFPLLNATTTWDFQSGRSSREDLLRAPDCGGPCRAPVTDRVQLPWVQS